MKSKEEIIERYQKKLEVSRTYYHEHKEKILEIQKAKYRAGKRITSKSNESW